MVQQLICTSTQMLAPVVLLPVLAWVIVLVLVLVAVQILIPWLIMLVLVMILYIYFTCAHTDTSTSTIGAINSTDTIDSTNTTPEK